MKQKLKVIPPVTVGQSIEVTIQGLTHQGEGIGKYEDFTIFIPQSLPGDQLIVRIISIKPSYARAIVEKQLQPSPDRIMSPCSISTTCGGCQWQEFNYQAQLQTKENSLKERLLKNLSISSDNIDELLQPIQGMDNPFYYRNKGQFPFQVQDNKVVAGFYEKGSHQVVSLEECLIQPPKINQLFQAVLNLIKTVKIPIYEETTQQGFLRHLFIRHAKETNQLLLVFITKDMPFPHQREVVDKLKQSFPELVGIVQNINDKVGNKILGEGSQILDGQDYLIERLGDFSFKIHYKAFYQVNPVQTLKLYDTVKTFANLTGTERLLDAYAGTGTIAIWLAQSAREVVAIEVVPEAIDDGRENCRLNQVTNLHFRKGKVEKVLPQLLKSEPFDCVILDPPRKGCQVEVIKALNKYQVPKIIYVSCNPATLMRDAQLLEKGYQLQRVQPIDMFPHTFHLDTVALFVKA